MSVMGKRCTISCVGGRSDVLTFVCETKTVLKAKSTYVAVSEPPPPQGAVSGMVSAVNSFPVRFGGRQPAIPSYKQAWLTRGRPEVSSTQNCRANHLAVVPECSNSAECTVLSPTASGAPPPSSACTSASLCGDTSAHRWSP